jgi:hypothetical protein
VHCIMMLSLTPWANVQRRDVAASFLMLQPALNGYLSLLPGRGDPLAKARL